MHENALRRNMPRMTEKERALRTELVQHLYRMHNVSMWQGMNATLNDLEEMHKMLHVDNYMAPPHTHSVSDDPYELGEMNLKYGAGYLQEILQAVKGEV